MIVNFLKRIHWSILICVLMSISSTSAHVLNETSAQVILRDGQVEVRLITDIDHLVSVLQNEQAWLMGDIEQVMPTNLSERQQEDFIKNALAKNMTLLVNQQAIAYERVVVETKTSGSSHGEEIVFQAKHDFANVDDIALSFPKNLGSVHASFVKPRYQYLGAGDTGHVVFHNR